MKTPIDEFLDVQADLSAVERFARTDVSGRADRWSDLIPLSQPDDGQQYRFEVDLDQCTGCKACVTACHNLNGLDEGESFRSVGVLVTEPVIDLVSAVDLRVDRPADVSAAPALQTVTTACHHCLDPGCLNGCPAEAYEKDPVTGIVKHLDDACIGCSYCTLTCPYNVPVYNDRLGIVRKCDMCADRLADGEAPACVQGCPTEAISISIVDVAGTSSALDEADVPDRMVPGAALSKLTRPTTTYRGRAAGTGSRPVDATSVRPQHGHLPLVLLLVLSQASVGAVAVALYTSVFNIARGPMPALIAGVALAVAAVVASVAHLGQPAKAWRVVLGWSHSWLSREAIVLGGYLASVGAAVAAAWFDVAGAVLLLAAAVVLGGGAVWCSSMIYVVTGRTWWRASQTVPRFVGTVLLAGTALLTVVAVADADWGEARLTAVALVVTLAAKLWLERTVLGQTDPDLKRTASLLRGELAAIDRARLRLALSGTAVLILSALGIGGGVVWVVLSLVGAITLLLGEIWERRLFFLACAPMDMPGGHR